MAKYNKSITTQNEQEAYKIALGIQRPEQTKEQTKLIAQGISKGIELYKKQQKAKAREQDKNRKKALKNREQEQSDAFDDSNTPASTGFAAKLPWILLIVSWIIFVVYALLGR